MPKREADTYITNQMPDSMADLTDNNPQNEIKETPDNSLQGRRIIKKPKSQLGKLGASDTISKNLFNFSNSSSDGKKNPFASVVLMPPSNASINKDSQHTGGDSDSTNTMEDSKKTKEKKLVALNFAFTKFIKGLLHETNENSAKNLPYFPITSADLGPVFLQYQKFRNIITGNDHCETDLGNNEKNSSSYTVENQSVPMENRSSSKTPISFEHSKPAAENKHSSGLFSFNASNDVAEITKRLDKPSQAFIPTSFKFGDHSSNQDALSYKSTKENPQMIFKFESKSPHKHGDTSKLNQVEAAIGASERPSAASGFSFSNSASNVGTNEKNHHLSQSESSNSTVLFSGDNSTQNELETDPQLFKFGTTKFEAQQNGESDAKPMNFAFGSTDKKIGQSSIFANISKAQSGPVFTFGTESKSPQNQKGSVSANDNDKSPMIQNNEKKTGAVDKSLSNTKKEDSSDNIPTPVDDGTKNSFSFPSKSSCDINTSTDAENCVKFFDGPEKNGLNFGKKDNMFKNSQDQVLQDKIDQETDNLKNSEEKSKSSSFSIERKDDTDQINSRNTLSEGSTKKESFDETSFITIDSEKKQQNSSGEASVFSRLSNTTQDTPNTNGTPTSTFKKTSVFASSKNGFTFGQAAAFNNTQDEKSKINAPSSKNSSFSAFSFGSGNVTTSQSETPFSSGFKFGQFGSDNSALKSSKNIAAVPEPSKTFVNDEVEGDESKNHRTKEQEEKLITGAGEENEDSLQEINCKIWKFKGKSNEDYIDYGVNVLKIKRSKNDSKVMRLLARQPGNGKVSLNCLIVDKIMHMVVGKKQKHVNMILPELDEHGKPGISRYAALCKTAEDAKKFSDTLQECIKMVTKEENKA